MRAVVKARPEYGAIEPMEMPMPKIEPTEVLVQIKACGICGSDLGLYDWREADRFRMGIPIKPPVIIGHEPAGVVAEIGSEVPAIRGLKVGDRVAADSWGGCGNCYYCRMGYFNMCSGPRKNIGSLANGGMAEYCAIPYFNLYKVPESVSWNEAAALQPLGVAMRGMETLVNFKAGDDVAVLGVGPIALFEALLARAAGAGKVFVTGLGMDKPRLALAEKLGFTALNSEEVNVKETILKATGGLGVDVVFDAISEGVPPEAVGLLKRIGQLVITATVGSKVTFNGAEFMSREIIITMNKFRNPSTFHRVINLLASGRVDVRPLITHSFKIEECDKAFKTLQSREGMKVLIVP
jgi:threonine dehydrogenase-like Zn-dependent dehydrogenase